MVMQLGQTNDPLELIPGDPGSVALVAGQMYDYSALLTEAGNGLSRIDTADGWSGAAADAFRARFKGQPGAWLEAGSCFREAAEALDGYVPVLVWAQQEGAVAGVPLNVVSTAGLVAGTGLAMASAMHSATTESTRSIPAAGPVTHHLPRIPASRPAPQNMTSTFRNSHRTPPIMEQLGWPPCGRRP